MMRKISIYSILVVMLLAFSPVHLRASDEIKPATTNTADAARAATLINRLEEIKEMDKSTLSVAEKKELRKEVRETKKELKTTGSGVYFSVGALLLVIILLIVLL
jgi:hypothetical protein